MGISLIPKDRPKNQSHDVTESPSSYRTLTVVCPRRPDLKDFRMFVAPSMALGISAGEGGTSSTRA